MRILHVIHSLNPVKGGTTTAVRIMTQAEKLTGATSSVLCLDDPSAPWLKDWPVNVTAAGPGLTRYGWTSKLRRSLAGLVRSTDLVVLHGLWQHHEGVVNRGCKEAGIPYIVYPHGMLDPWAIQHTLFGRILKMASWCLKTRRVLRQARGICFTCEGERLAAMPMIASLDAKTFIVPLAVEAPPALPETLKSSRRAEEPALKDRRVILFLGRLDPKKGCDLLVEAFARWKDEKPQVRASFHLRLVGPPVSTGYRDYLSALAGGHEGVNAGISFRGMVAGEAKWREIAGAEALILPSHQENFGLVLGEALSCGLPLLLSNKVNVWDWAVNAGAGFAEAPTRDGITALLNKWEAQDPAQRRTMSIAARALYEKKFSLDSMTARIRQLLDEIATT